MATALYPDLENPDMVFPTLAFDLLPVGFRGLILAALAAAIFSSLEAILNSTATLFTMDFVRGLRPELQDRTLVWTGRAATLGFMVLAAAWAPQIAEFPTLWQYLQSILAYVTPPVVAVFLLGLFWPRGNRQGALVTLGAGIPLGVISWLANEVFAVVEIQYLYAAGIMLLISTGLFLLASLLSAPPEAQRRECCTWNLRQWREEYASLRERPWYADYRWLALGLTILTAAVVGWWW